MSQRGEVGEGVTSTPPSAILPPPYASGEEHLADLFARLDLLLRREMVRGNARKPADILGFAAITEDEVLRLLNGRAGEPVTCSPDELAIERALRDLERRIAHRVTRALANGVALPLVELAHRFALTGGELDILVAALAVEWDRRYERIYGYLHDDMTRRLPSPGLTLSLYSNNGTEQLSVRTLLSATAPLRYYRLIEMLADTPSMPWLSRPIRIDERIVLFALGDQAVDSHIAPYVIPSQHEAGPALLCASQQQALETLCARLPSDQKSGGMHAKPVVYLRRTPEGQADAAVAMVAAQLGMPVLAFDCELLAETAQVAGTAGQGSAATDSLLLYICREALLSGTAIYLRDIDRLLDLPAGGAYCRALLRAFSEMGTFLFASGQKSWCWQMPSWPAVLHVVELPAAGLKDQVEAWSALSGERVPLEDLQRLASLHPLPLFSIHLAWKLAKDYAAVEGAGVAPSMEHLRRACRAQVAMPANSLARRIQPRHDWDDLVLPAPQREQLAALCGQMKHASVVYGEWNFERKLTLGRGLNALFCGPPGTGKTLAAEVIAGELGLELLQIDLSKITSKYIGETEKNLRQLFDDAAGANAILFFDEADALLGKRSAVKDAHDRYANTETAYLLQKMEEYPGITFLSTNLRQNIDEAFTRRMRFIVEFTLPEEAERLRIWKGIWPAGVPLASDVDLAALAAKFRLSGGSIRNIALSAAFLAAEEREPIAMRHLMRALRRELQNMGRLVSDIDADVRSS